MIYMSGLKPIADIDSGLKLGDWLQGHSVVLFFAVGINRTTIRSRVRNPDTKVTTVT